MNVIQLFIEVQKTKNASLSIKDLIIDDFKKASSDSSLYLSKIKEEWNIQKNNLKSLYSLKYLVVFQNRNNIKYFIFDSSQTGISNKNKTTLDLLILSDIENIDHSINTVVEDIKGILRNREVKVLKENNIFLFPHNT